MYLFHSSTKQFQILVSLQKFKLKMPHMRQQIWRLGVPVTVNENKGVLGNVKGF